MKRWAAITVTLYVLLLVVFTVPVILAGFGEWWLGPDSGITWSDAFAIYTDAGYWICVAVFGLAQALLLVVPVGMAERRPPPRRRLIAPIITTGFLTGTLFLSGIFCLLCAAFADDAFEVFAFVGELARTDSSRNPLGEELWTSPTLTGSPMLDFILGVVLVLGVLWFVWAMIFYQFAKADAPDALMKRSVRWLLRGSILELLVAVPTHIFVRSRGDCCAPMGTFWGIASGVAIMLLCFGPGVFFLFAERFGRLRPERSPVPAPASAHGESEQR
jgi:hypothetical protein